MTEISNRAILVKLSISTWMATKFDRRVTTKVTTDYHATANAGRFNKHLLAGAQLHKNVLNAAANARNVYYVNTLPWADEGERLLPTKNFFGFTEKMRGERAKFDTALKEFLPAYPQLRDAAKLSHGGMHDAADFPTEAEVARRFGWHLDILPLPAAGDFRVNLPAEHLELAQQAMKERTEVAVQGAMQDVWKRLHQSVVRIKQAAAPEGKVYSNLMQRTQDTLDLLESLNITEDADVERFKERIETELQVDPDDLRDDEAVRASTEQKADEILEAMRVFYREGK